MKTIFTTGYYGLTAGIATRYGLEGPEIEPGGGEIFRIRPDRPWGPPSFLYNRYRVFPGGKAAGEWCWPLTPIFSAEVLIGQSYTSTRPKGLVAHKGGTFLLLSTHYFIWALLNNPTSIWCPSNNSTFFYFSSYFWGKWAHHKSLLSWLWKWAL